MLQTYSVLRDRMLVISEDLGHKSQGAKDLNKQENDCVTDHLNVGEQLRKHLF